MTNPNQNTKETLDFSAEERAAMMKGKPTSLAACLALADTEAEAERDSQAWLMFLTMQLMNACGNKAFLEGGVSSGIAATKELSAYMRKLALLASIAQAALGNAEVVDTPAASND